MLAKMTRIVVSASRPETSGLIFGQGVYKLVDDAELRLRLEAVGRALALLRSRTSRGMPGVL